jgi:hypothetical protein
MNAGLQVLRSDRDPNVDGASRQAYPVKTDISIRLWTSTQLHAKPSDLSWRTDSNLVSMIADVISAAQGSAANELRCGMSAHFNSATQALKAAKSIERSVAEFSKRRPNDCFGAAIAVHRPVELRPFLEGDPGPLSPASSLLRQAQPGQILVSRETHDHLRELPGIQFRPLNPDAHEDEAASGDAELLWTSPETYVLFATHLQEAIQRLPVPIEQESPASEDIRPFQPPTTTSSDFRGGTFSTGRLSAIDPDEGEVSWMASHRLLISFMAVAVLALATVYALPAWRKRPPAANSVIESGHSQQTPKPGAWPKELPSNPASVAPQPAEPVKIAPAPAAAIRKPEAPKTQSPSKPAEAKPLGEYEGFASRDVPALLKRAQADAGAGDYDSSRHEYDIILHLEPGNQAAREGLARVNMSVNRDR